MDTKEQQLEEHRPANGEPVPKMGLLFSNIAREFGNLEHQFIPEDGVAVFHTKSSDLVFEVHHMSKRSLLSRTTEGEFRFRIPNSPPGNAEIRLNHTGNWKRTGISAKLKRGGQVAQEVADFVIADPQFCEAFLPLDSRNFYLIQDEQGWMVKTTQMGASFVGMMLPPVKRYIPMGNEQTTALMASFRRLQVLLSGNV